MPRILLCIIFASLASCGTLFAADQKQVTVLSNPPGAQVAVDGAPLGMTPTVVTVDNHRAHTVTLTQGGASTSCQLTTGVGGGWVILDIFAGLFIPMIIDIATGEGKTVDQNQCAVGMPPPQPAPVTPTVYIVPSPQGPPPQPQPAPAP